jgi:glycosyltransferase involved in cell wall biosynthesis
MIPKIIHQIWIGPKPAPTKFMDTWKEKHPDFEYIRWSEAEMKKRDLPLSCVNRIDEMEEINGKADIIRWEILYHYGGYFFDADSVCLEPMNELFTEVNAFASWENEQCRKGLVAPVAMGFPPKHPLVRACIEWIHQNEVSNAVTRKRAWVTVGPGLITQMQATGKYPDVVIYPSYFFLPTHWTGVMYEGHGRMFGHQEWGSTKQIYDTMNQIPIPERFQTPDTKDPYKNVSILVCSYNTNAKYVQDCLESIKHQNGLFNIELVWINDGSDTLHTELLKKALTNFERSTRFTKMIYCENDSNKGIGYSLNKGVTMCTHEIICRMDSDDMMLPNRIRLQLEFMKNTPECMLTGAQAQLIREQQGKTAVIHTTKFPTMTLEQFKAKPEHWFAVHPTYCFRKAAILEIGNYDSETYHMLDDFDLLLRVLKKYGKVYNMPEMLLYYRIHEGQVTHVENKLRPKEHHEKRIERIKDILFTEKKYNYTAMMIEPRRHRAIEVVLKNITKCLNDDWGIQVFVGDHNETYVRNIVRDMQNDRVKVVNIKLENMNHLTYSKFMTEPLIYDHIPTETFMIFQTDSFINEKNKHYLDRFISYDYVGAPWKDHNVGNGGISIRKKSKMLEIMKKVPFKMGMYEDKYFSLVLNEWCSEEDVQKWTNEIKLKKPTFELAKTFAIETVFHNDFFAVHKPWEYLKKEELDYIIKSCDNLNTLILHQT